MPPTTTAEHTVARIKTALIEELALTLAASRRVLLIEPSFEFLSRMAMMPVAELVIISQDADPDAAPGETPGGAPLRIRADWKERPRSKDLIVDTANKAKKDEIERILKKAGLFLSQDRRKRPKALDVEQAIKTELTGLFSYGQPTTAPFLAENIEPTSGPVIYVFSRAQIEIPPFAVRGPAEDSSTLEATKQQLAEAQSALRDMQATVARLETEAERVDSEIEELRKKVEEKDRKHKLAAEETEKLKSANAVLMSEQSELENDYETIRSELAETRIECRRLSGAHEKINQVREQMNAEVELLQKKLLDIDGPKAELAQVDSDRTSLLVSYEKTLRTAGQIFKRLIPGQALPATPRPGVTAAQIKLIDAWLATAGRRAEQAYVRREEQTKVLRSTRDKLRRLKKTATILRSSASKPAERVTDIPRAMPAEPLRVDDALKDQLNALSDALLAEQKRREVAERMVADIRRSTQFALTDRTRLLTEINQQNQTLHNAELARLIAEETMAQVQAELQERVKRLDEFEAMLSTHDQVQQLMTDAIEEAQDAKDEAEHARRLAEENLRIMRLEFERIKDKP
ncbi:MAG: hypothetical protein VYA30_13400 [Myxococcota bacterium]|nr:hypothetical protein [Myxococcota bacterium]